MSLRRVACFTLFPLAFVAYACSSDDSTSPNSGTDAGIDSSIQLPGPKTDGSTDIDGSDQPGDDAGDAGADADATVIDHPPSCDENPLAAGDAGAVVFDSDGGGLTEVTTGPFLDGVQWTDDGVVYSEVTGQVVVKNGPDGGARAIFRASGAGTDLPVGNARSGDFIYTAISRTSGGKGTVLRTQLDGGQATSFDPGTANPSDIVVSSKGIVYFTDGALIDDQSVVTGIYSISADGTTVTTISRVQNDAGSIKKAKGIALSADESALFVAYYDDKTRIQKWTLDAAGAASNPTDLAVTLADNPVGLAIDNAGNLWVAESPEGAALRGQVEVFSATGTKWGSIPFNDARPTDVAFGGADGTTVYVATERGAAGPGSPATFGSLYKLTTRCPGVR